MRLFIAIDVPDVVTGPLDAIVSPVRHRHTELRWNEPRKWHFTLAFLGEVDAATARRAEAATDEVAAATEPFAVALGQAGRFGQGVLWLGLDDPSYAAVVAVGERLRAALDARGVPFDDKPFHPHLTLARSRRGTKLGVSRSKVAAVEEVVRTATTPMGWDVDELVLVRSEQDPDGGRYVRLHEAPLGAPPQPPGTE